MFILPESPKYLINKNKTREARKTLTKIARVNRIADCDFSDKSFKVEKVSRSDVQDALRSEHQIAPDHDQYDSAEVEEVDYEGKVIELCKYKSLRINLIVITCVNFISVLSVY